MLHFILFGSMSVSLSLSLCIYIFGAYIGCVCFVCDVFFLFPFFHLLLHLLPVKSESPKETIAKICSLAFLSTAKNALNLEFSTLTVRFLWFMLLRCSVSLVCVVFFGNFTVTLCNGIGVCKRNAKETCSHAHTYGDQKTFSHALSNLKTILTIDVL